MCHTVVNTTKYLFRKVAVYAYMAETQRAYETSEKTTDGRQKVAGRCCECGAVYSAWVLSNGTVHPIGKKGGCRCGASNFEAISK